MSVEVGVVGPREELGDVPIALSGAVISRGTVQLLTGSLHYPSGGCVPAEAFSRENHSLTLRPCP